MGIYFGGLALNDDTKKCWGRYPTTARRTQRSDGHIIELQAMAEASAA